MESCIGSCPYCVSKLRLYETTDVWVSVSSPQILNWSGLGPRCQFLKPLRSFSCAAGIESHYDSVSLQTSPFFIIIVRLCSFNRILKVFTSPNAHNGCTFEDGKADLKTSRKS